MWIFCTKNNIFTTVYTDPIQVPSLACGGTKVCFSFPFPESANDNIYALIDVIFLNHKGWSKTNNITMGRLCQQAVVP